MFGNWFKMEKKAIKILKIEIIKDDFLYMSKNGICGTLMKDPFYRTEIYRSPIYRKVESITDLWDVLSEEKCDIHFRDYPISIRKITDEMENALLSEITNIEKSSEFTIISIPRQKGVLITQMINRFVFSKERLLDNCN